MRCVEDRQQILQVRGTLVEGTEDKIPDGEAEECVREGDSGSERNGWEAGLLECRDELEIGVSLAKR